MINLVFMRPANMKKMHILPYKSSSFHAQEPLELIHTDEVLYQYYEPLVLNTICISLMILVYLCSFIP